MSEPSTSKSLEESIAEAFGRGAEIRLGEERPQRRDDDNAVRGESLSALMMNMPHREDSVRHGDPQRRGLYVTGAWIEGTLDLAGMNIDYPVTFDRCHFERAPRLDEARIQRSISFSGSACPGLSARSMRADGDLRLESGFTSWGKVDLEGSYIGGLLVLANAVLHPPLPIGDEMNDSPYEDAGRTVLNASRLRVGEIQANDLIAAGMLWLISARIDGVLNLRDATLSHPGGRTIQGERLEVGQSIWLRDDFKSDGVVFLRNARIQGSLDVTKGTLTSTKAVKVVLDFRHGKAGRTVSFDGSTVGGSIDLTYADVASDVLFTDATFEEPAAEEGVDGCVDADHGRAALRVEAQQLRASQLDARFLVPPRFLDLRNSTIDTIKDARKSWPVGLDLDGCRYRALKGCDDTTMRDRLGWLELGRRKYAPARYDQLISTYRASGEERLANRVGLEKQRRRVKQLTPVGKAWSRLQDVTIGYGYQPWKAACWIVALVVVGTFVFGWNHPIPNGAVHPPFCSLAYAVDLLVPVIDLGTKSNFTAVGWTAGVAWLLRAAGWMLTTAAVAGLTRSLNRAS